MATSMNQSCSGLPMPLMLLHGGSRTIGGGTSTSRRKRIDFCIRSTFIMIIRVCTSYRRLSWALTTLAEAIDWLTSFVSILSPSCLYASYTLRTSVMCYLLHTCPSIMKGAGVLVMEGIRAFRHLLAVIAQR